MKANGCAMPHWHTHGGPAARALQELAEALKISWWVTPAGLVRFGALTYPAAAPDGLEVLDDRPERGASLVSLVEEPLLPGTTWNGHQVLSVEHELTPKRWSATVRYSSPADDQLKALVRAFQLRTPPPFEAEVLSQTGQELELRLLMSDEVKDLWELDRGLQGVPLALQGGWSVTLAPGARVVVEWLDGDRQKPVVRTVLDGFFQAASFDGKLITVGTNATSISLGKGLKPVVSTGDSTDPVVNGKPALISVAANTVVKV